MGEKYRQLKRDDRLKLEALYCAGNKVTCIAASLGVSRQTIYNELKRGRYTKRNSDLTETISYSCDLAEQKYQEHLSNKGGRIKIGSDMAYAEYLENKIINEKYSPAAALASAVAAGFDTNISVGTLYSYIDKGIFLNLTNKYLPVKSKKKKKKNSHATSKRASAGTSIILRPEYIERRDMIGHWEMDTVVGARGNFMIGNLLCRFTKKKLLISSNI